MASKPVLRNLLMTQTKQYFVVAVGTAFGLAMSYKYFVQHRRRRAYEDFRKNFDADAAYQRMKKANVFQFYRGED